MQQMIVLCNVAHYEKQISGLTTVLTIINGTLSDPRTKI